MLRLIYQIKCKSVCAAQKLGKNEAISAEIDFRCASGYI